MHRRRQRMSANRHAECPVRSHKRTYSQGQLTAPYRRECARRRDRVQITLSEHEQKAAAFPAESERAKTGLIAWDIAPRRPSVLYVAALPRWRAHPLSAGHIRRPTRASGGPCPRRVGTATLRPWPSCSPGRGDPHRHSRGRQGPARLRLLLGRDRLPARRQIARLGRGPRGRRGANCSARPQKTCPLRARSASQRRELTGQFRTA